MKQVTYKLKAKAGPLPKVKMRRYSIKGAAAILEYLRKNENYLEESTVRTACLPLVVKKKDDVDRICINYILINRLISGMGCCFSGRRR